MFYVLPIVGVGTRADPRRPKYVREIPITDWAMVDHADTAIVWTPVANATLEANADVLVVPPLDNNVAVVATQNALETLNIPAGWINAGMTYREVLRVIIGMAQIIQRCNGLGVQLPIAGHLNDTIGSLPANVRQTLSDASDSLGLDRSAIIGTTTVRAALKILGQQFIDGVGVRLGDL